MQDCNDTAEPVKGRGRKEVNWPSAFHRWEQGFLQGGTLVQLPGTGVTESQVSQKVKKITQAEWKKLNCFFSGRILASCVRGSQHTGKWGQPVTGALWTWEVGETFLRRAASHSSSCSPQPWSVFCQAGCVITLFFSCSWGNFATTGFWVTGALSSYQPLIS